MNSYSHTEENYLKTTYQLTQEIDSDFASTKDLAELLDVNPSSVSDMLKKLSDKKLINYTKYKGVTLSSKGKSVAVALLRSHRIWETFLSSTLKFGWEEVHEIAEELEHIRNKVLIDRLDSFLNYPKVDPHGDPIPNTDGKIDPYERISLLEAPMEKELVVIGVNDGDRQLLKMMDEFGISLGTVIHKKQVFEFDQSSVVLLGGKEVQLSEKVCQNIFVKI